MGLLTKRPEQRTRRMRVLTASGQRMGPGSADKIRALSVTRQDWQGDAWGYRDMIGEIRFAGQFLGRAASRVILFPALVTSDTDDPEPLATTDDTTIPEALRAAALEELERLPLRAGYRFLGVLAENFEIAGECWLHGYEDPDTDEECWEILSTSEVLPGQDGLLSMRRAGESQSRPVNEDTEEMIRLWAPHPRYSNLADSPMRTLLDACETLLLAEREQRAASRSRFANNGLLLLPDGFELKRENQDTGEDEPEARDFMADFVAAMLAAIQNEGDPGAVAPAVVMGDAGEIAAVRHLRFDREDSPKLIEKIEAALRRIARGLDVPPEIIAGMGDVNHWSAWQIDASTFRYHIAPLVQMMADSLTEGFLRPALLARGFASDLVRRITIWYDASGLTENPNRGQDAKDAFDRGGIGFKALANALGFGEDDAPTDEEFARMVALKSGVDQGTAAAMLAVMLGQRAVPQPDVVDGTVMPDRQGTPDPAPAPAITGPGQAPPDNGAPEEPDGLALLNAILAAAGPPENVPAGSQPEVLDELSRTLLEIDRELRDRLLDAADAAMTRALERAGAKVRSKAQRDPKLRARLTAELAGVPADRVPALLGRTVVLALGTDERELLEDAFAALEGKLGRWTKQAAERVVALLLKTFGLSKDSDRGRAVHERIVGTVTGRLAAGWQRLRTGLMGTAERWLFDARPDNEPGEAPESPVPVGIIRSVLAYLGGSDAEPDDTSDRDQRRRSPDRPTSGVGTGPVTADVLTDQGAFTLGYEWVYGVSFREREFQPHRELDGDRFATWRDDHLATAGTGFSWVGPFFHPGDHDGCLCDTRRVWGLDRAPVQPPAAPNDGIDDSDPDEDVVGRRLAEPESRYMRDARRLAESDDAAGRRGTTAQETRDQRDMVVALRERWLDGDRA